MTRSLAELAANPRNPRAITKEAASGLAYSMAEFGDLSGITYNRRTGVLIAGHQRVAELRKAGAKEWVDAKDGAFIQHPKTGEDFQVRVVDWPIEKERAALLIANHPGIQARYTPAAEALVVQVVSDFPEVAKATNVEGILDQIGAEWGAKAAKTEQEIGVPDPAEVTSRVGDLWILGPHRLVVGDSLAESVQQQLLEGVEVAMVATDPPYAIYGSSTGVSADVADDKMVRPFFEALFRLVWQRLPWFGHAYLCCDWRSWPAIFDAARRTGMSAKNLIVWDKGQQGMGSNYANCYELLGFFSKVPSQGKMSYRKAGARAVLRPNIVRIPRAKGDERQHNAAKPVALMAEVIGNSSDRGQWVLEPFCGSGTTILACQQLGRRCAASEIEPKWADVAIARWEKLANAKATLGEGGPSFAAIRAAREVERRGRAGKLDGAAVPGGGRPGRGRGAGAATAAGPRRRREDDGKPSGPGADGAGGRVPGATRADRKETA